VTLGLLILAGGLLVAFIWQARRHEQRIDSLLRAQQRDRATPNPDTAALTATVENLCQRIQAPQQAVIDHALAQPVGPQPTVPLPDDDNAFWVGQETREELADRLLAAEVNVG
jgi:hypothetical protein